MLQFFLRQPVGYTVVLNLPAKADGPQPQPQPAQPSVQLRFPRAKSITVSALQAELERQHVSGWRVVSLVGVADQVTYSAQPLTGFFFVDDEKELSPGTYEARLGHDDWPPLASSFASSSSSGAAGAHTNGEDDRLPTLVVPWDDVGRAKVALEALLLGQADAAPLGAADNSSERATKPVLDYLNNNANAEKHDFFAAVVSRNTAAVRYMVAISAEAVVVAIDCTSNRAQLRALVDPGAPSRVADYGMANSAAINLAK